VVFHIHPWTDFDRRAFNCAQAQTTPTSSSCRRVRLSARAAAIPRELQSLLCACKESRRWLGGFVGPAFAFCKSRMKPINMHVANTKPATRSTPVPANVGTKTRWLFGTQNHIRRSILRPTAHDAGLKRSNDHKPNTGQHWKTDEANAN